MPPFRLYFPSKTFTPSIPRLSTLRSIPNIRSHATKPHPSSRPPTTPIIPIRQTLTLLTLSFLTYHFLPLSQTTGPSMLPTILVSDYILWSPLHRRGRGLKVGDIVAAYSPYEPGGAIVKRVVGMPGDIICVLRQHAGMESAVSAGEVEQGTVETSDAVLGGKYKDEVDKVPEDMVPGSGRYITVPVGHCWVEGDNALWSVDSRHYGPIPLGLVVGKVLAVRGESMRSWRLIGHDDWFDDVDGIGIEGD